MTAGLAVDSCRGSCPAQKRLARARRTAALALTLGLMAAVLGPAATVRADEAEILWLVRRPEAVAAMGLSDEAVARLRDLTDAQDATLFPARILPPDEQAEVFRPLVEQTRRFLQASLTAAERAAVERVRWRTLGLKLFTDDAVAGRLGLTDPQRRKATARIETLESAIKQRLAPPAGREAAAAAAVIAPGTQKEIAALRKEAQRDLVALLTPPQRVALAEGLGPAIDPSTWGGPRFAAPPLPTGGTWLGGQGVDLASLRGRVVLLHFFASECINCQRNFPHYKAWQAEFDPADVAIVGVQSPEIDAERDAKRVAARVEAADLTHPILMDLDHAAWKAWGQTMWPTVYAIDKRGRIVTFWMGELDWQGAGAQIKMADLVRTLIAEP